MAGYLKQLWGKVLRSIIVVPRAPMSEIYVEITPRSHAVVKAVTSSIDNAERRMKLVYFENLIDRVQSRENINP